MARATGAALRAFADYFSTRRPDLLVVLGDRYEILAAAIAAHFSGIPIAHISGGDVTEGAVDDAIRHSITKMSTLHFPGCEQSRRRIIQMGESPERVFNVGEPGVENCLNTPLLSVEELSESLQFDLTAGPYSVVTFHPVTLEDNTAERQLHELIAAMDVFPAMSYIVTHRPTPTRAGGPSTPSGRPRAPAGKTGWWCRLSGCGAIFPPSRAQR